jgi:DNA-3-methyladenine glycosylase II
MTGRIITGPDCLAEGAAWLAAREPRLAHALGLIGPLPLRLKPDGFAELASAIVGQQVSVASAAAIWARVVAAGLITPEAVLSATDAQMQGCGLSRPKIRYLRALAEAGIDYDALRDAPTEAVIRTLTAVTGIGPWTAEIYAMFCLGRADAFAPGDLAMQIAARDLFGLADRPTERQLRAMAEAWSPWRSVAARILWGYYLRDTGREGVR